MATNVHQESISRVYKVIFLVACSMGGVAVVFFSDLHTEVWQLVQTIVEWSSTIHPALLFGVAAVAAAFPVPAAPLYVYAGATYGMAISVVGISLMVLINISLGYAMTAWGLDGFVRRIVQWTGYSLPECPESQQWRFIILVRITPGLPVSIQNYILGLGRVPVGTYLIASWPIQTAIGIGLALSGGGIYRGKVGSIVTGVLLVALVMIAGRIFTGKTKAVN